MMQRTTRKRMREMENRWGGEKKKGFPASFISSNFTLYVLWQNGKYRWRSENVTVFFLFIFSEQTVTAGKKLHLCKGTELVFFFFALLKNALVNDKTNKAREVNKRGRTRYPLRWAVQNGQSYGFLKQLKKLRNWKRKWCAHSRTEWVKKSRKRQGSIREKVELTEMVFHSRGEKDRVRRWMRERRGKKTTAELMFWQVAPSKCRERSKVNRMKDEGTQELFSTRRHSIKTEYWRVCCFGCAFMISVLFLATKIQV